MKEGALKVVYKIGEVIAPRFWVFDKDTLYGSSHYRKPWTHDEPMHVPEIFRAGHAVYAFEDVNLLYKWLAENQTEPVIVGTVRLWGTVFRSLPSPTKCGGWRASYGRVHTLENKVIDGKTRISDDADLRLLRQRYRCL